MKNLLFVTAITIKGHTNNAYYASYTTALRNATLYVDDAEAIEIEVWEIKEGMEWYTFKTIVYIKTEQQIKDAE